MANVIDIVRLGVVKYPEALKIQKRLFDGLLDAKGGTAGKESGQVLLLCEHPHVYTLGKSGNEANLLKDGEFLKSVGAEYYRTDRGGDVTYHGPGQLVGYPILDLQKCGMSLRDYIWALEESVIKTVAEYGIRGERLEGATGVWLEPHTARERKICAIGVRVSRFVTMHGFALNVNTDLGYFSHINPCGISDKGVTSVARECGREVPVEEVAEKYVTHFLAFFLND